MKTLFARNMLLFSMASSLLYVLPVAQGQAEHPTCNSEIASNDDRCTMEASARIGLAIDTFAAKNTQQYLYANLSDASGKAERAVGGFDFAYRLRG